MDDPPLNECVRSPSEIDNDIVRALDQARANIEMIAEYCKARPYPRVLELGPGYDFGAQIILSEIADVTVADRWLAKWNDEYHPEFYRRLLAAWGSPCRPLEAVIAANDSRAAIKLLAEPAENLWSVADQSFDVVLSNAVLEHVYDLPLVIRELVRVTTPGGVNSHQVDFRDHRNFDKPLEFLLIDDAEFGALFNRRHGETGNRWRHGEFAELLRAAGFSIEDISTELASGEYMTDFLPRLRRSESSRFTAMDDAELSIIGARFVARAARAT